MQTVHEEYQLRLWHMLIDLIHLSTYQGAKHSMYMFIIITQNTLHLGPRRRLRLRPVNRLAQVSPQHGAGFTPLQAWCQNAASPDYVSLPSDPQKPMLCCLTALPPEALNITNLKAQHRPAWRCWRGWLCHSDPAVPDNNPTHQLCPCAHASGPCYLPVFNLRGLRTFPLCI